MKWYKKWNNIKNKIILKFNDSKMKWYLPKVKMLKAF